jgi:hypothetical protein
MSGNPVLNVNDNQTHRPKVVSKQQCPFQTIPDLTLVYRQEMPGFE